MRVGFARRTVGVAVTRAGAPAVTERTRHVTWRARRAGGWYLPPGMRIPLALTLVLAACGRAPVAPAAPAAAPAAPAPAAPAPAAPSLEDRLDALVTATLADTPLLDLQVAVVKDGRPLLVRAYGPAELGGKAPLTLDSPMQIGSVTKQFTAVAVLQLVDAGKLRLTDAVARFVPGIAATITIADLLHQTSGLVEYVTEENLGKSPEEHLAVIVAGTPTFAPGARWEYCNSNYFLLGRIVEQVSGQSYGAYLHDHLLAPAGLAATHLCTPADHVVGTVADHGALSAGGSLPPSVYGGAGALCSTAGDLLRWQDALSGGKLLTPASLAFMTTAAKLSDGSTSPYAVGLLVDAFLGQPRLWHNGTIPDSAQAVLDLYPEAHLQVVLLSRTVSFPPGAVMRRLGDALAGNVLLGDAPVDAALAARVVGTYASGNLTVTVRLTDDDGLHVVLPDGKDSKLLHTTGNDFVVAVNPHGTYRFAADASSITAILDGKPVGELKRVSPPARP